MCVWALPHTYLLNSVRRGRDNRSLLIMSAANEASSRSHTANRNAPQPAPPAACPSSVNDSTVPQRLKANLWACLSLTFSHPH